MRRPAPCQSLPPESTAAARSPPAGRRHSISTTAADAWRAPFRRDRSVTVVLGLVRPLLRHADVGGLLVGELGQLRIEFLQLQAGDLRVQMLGQGVDADRILAGIALLPQLDLG